MSPAQLAWWISKLEFFFIIVYSIVSFCVNNIKLLGWPNYIYGPPGPAWEKSMFFGTLSFRDHSCVNIQIIQSIWIQVFLVKLRFCVDLSSKKYFLSVFHGFLHRFFWNFSHISQKQAYFNHKYVSLYHTWDLFVAYYERKIGLIFSKQPQQ